MGSTVTIGRLAGIPIRIQALWLAIVGLLTYTLGHDYYPGSDPALSVQGAYALGLVSALALFAGIVLHELGHAIAARRRGIEVDEIDLWLLGGMARIHGDPRRPADELVFALAGPAVTAGLLALAGGLRFALGGGAAAWERAFVDYGVLVNATILGFNLLPAFPLDGGRVLRALLWRRLGDQDRATRIAAGAGRGFGWALIALGLLSFADGIATGIWLALVGGFLVLAARAEAGHAHTHAVLGGARAADLMSAPVASLAESLRLDGAAAAFAERGFGAFPVVDGAGRAVGLLSRDVVDAVPPAVRASLTVGDLAGRGRGTLVLVDPAVEIERLLELPAFARAGRSMVVDAAGRPAGVVSVSDVERRLGAGAA